MVAQPDAGCTIQTRLQNRLLFPCVSGMVADMHTIEPWLISPELTQDRLQVIAKEIVRVRAEALLEHRPEVGDDAWSFGCRAYRRTCFALASLALTGDFPWLRVSESGLACSIMVEAEQLRFYCGEAEKPSSRSLRRGISDLIAQGRFSFFEDELAASDEGWFWLIAIETRDDGSVLRVVVLQANPRGEVRHSWEVPTETTVASLGVVSTIVREAVELPPPVVGPKVAAEREASADAMERADGTGE